MSLMGGFCIVPHTESSVLTIGSTPFMNFNLEAEARVRYGKADAFAAVRQSRFCRVKSCRPVSTCVQTSHFCLLSYYQIVLLPSTVTSPAANTATPATVPQQTQGQGVGLPSNVSQEFGNQTPANSEHDATEADLVSCESGVGSES